MKKKRKNASTGRKPTTVRLPLETHRALKAIGKRWDWSIWRSIYHAVQFAASRPDFGPQTGGER